MTIMCASDAFHRLSVELAKEEMCVAWILDKQELRKWLAKFPFFGEVLDYFGDKEWQEEKLRERRPLIRAFGEECDGLARYRKELDSYGPGLGSRHGDAEMQILRHAAKDVDAQDPSRVNVVDL